MNTEERVASAEASVVSAKEFLVTLAEVIKQRQMTIGKLQAKRDRNGHEDAQLDQEIKDMEEKQQQDEASAIRIETCANELKKLIEDYRETNDRWEREMCHRTSTRQ